MQEGLAMIDDGHRDGKRQYWLPSVFSISTSVADIWQKVFKSTQFCRSYMCIIHFYDLMATTVLARYIYICYCKLMMLYQQKRPINLINWIFNHGFFLIGDQNLSLRVEWFDKKLDSTYNPKGKIKYNYI